MENGIEQGKFDGRCTHIFLSFFSSSINPQKPVAELVGNHIFFNGNKYEIGPQIIV